MKLTRFRVDGESRIGVIEDEVVLDVTDDVDSFSNALEMVTDGETISGSNDTYSRTKIDYLPPTEETNTILAAALNYESHVTETSRAVPEWPLLFLKMYRSLTGHREPIPHYTSITNELDYEAELAAVIGSPARNVSESEALDYVAGYTILNDVSARDIQNVMVGDVRRLDWFSAKALERCTPVGPHVVTTDGVSDPMDLRITSWVNGKKMQDESSAMMIRDIPELVSFASSRIELQPGDIIATGTPEGVGLFQDLLLTDGDTVEIEIEQVGRLSNTVQQVG
jgi:2-keto-4-pentenoate hydratase/2-oxohepta-3-ene-1,7-dioic acid hydratase in catechol pathway